MYNGICQELGCSTEIANAHSVSKRANRLRSHYLLESDKNLISVTAHMLPRFISPHDAMVVYSIFIRHPVSPRLNMGSETADIESKDDVIVQTADTTPSAETDAGGYNTVHR